VVTTFDLFSLKGADMAAEEEVDPKQLEQDIKECDASMEELSKEIEKMHKSYQAIRAEIDANKRKKDFDEPLEAVE
jgi:hypothetical protein